MIINIRGTSGSGKSTIIKRIMEEIPFEPKYVEGRKKPLFYTNDKKEIAILGHYETKCGGCDTISKYDQCYETIDQLASQGYLVFYEGLRQSGDFKRAWWLYNEKKHPLEIWHLNTSVEECIASVENRRKENGNDKPLNPANTIDKFECVLKSNKKLAEHGVPVRSMDRNTMFMEARRLCG